MIPAERTTAIATVMRELSREIDMLGATLCVDPHVAAQFATQLQAVDLIAQIQNALADVLGADCAACAATDVTIEALRVRLEHCLPHQGCTHTHHLN